MNLLDLGIICVFALFAFIGWHNGFFLSMLNTAAFFVSWLVSALFSPAVAKGILGMEGVANAFLYYTEGAELIANVELRRMSVSRISGEAMSELMAGANLPAPLDKLVAQNIAGEVFAADGITTAGDYFNQTIVYFAINVIAFLIVFLIARLLIGFVLRGVDFTVGLPMLKHFDGALGAGFGVVRGFFTLFVLFMIAPTLFVILPFPEVRQYVDESFLGTFFTDSNFLLSFVRGVI